MTRDARGAVRQFVLDRNPGLSPEALADRTPLLTDRLVTSLHVLDLLLVLESLRCSPIDARSISPEAFGSIDSIIATFLEQEA